MSYFTHAIRIAALLCIALSAVLPSHAFGANSPLDCRLSLAPAYDEARTPEGRVRPAYIDVEGRARTGRSAVAFEQRFAKLSGGVVMDARPRVLTVEDRDQIVAGIQQRARAIRMFAQDYYSGRNTFVESGVFTLEQINRVAARTGEDKFVGQIDPARIGFHYGPDIMRGPDGRFYVIEDNPGYLGGFSDLLLSRTAMLELAPEYRDFLPTEISPERFYSDLIETWRRQSLPQGGKIVMLTHSGANDTQRMAKILEPAGAGWVSPASDSSLSFDSQGVWYRQTPRAPAERVGFIFLWGEYPYVRFGADVRRAHHAGKVAVSQSAGMEFVGDKELLSGIDELVRFYLGEEPILSSIPSRSFLESGLFDEVFTGENYRSYVIKQVEGRGGKGAGGYGTGVYIGPKMTPAQAKEAAGAVRAKPSHYIAQPFFPMSRYQDMILDLRFHSVVTPDSIVTSPVPISRGISEAQGDGKVNISGKGRLFGVYVENRPEKLVDREPEPRPVPPVYLSDPEPRREPVPELPVAAWWRFLTWLGVR